MRDRAIPTPLCSSSYRLYHPGGWWAHLTVGLRVQSVINWPTLIGPLGLQIIGPAWFLWLYQLALNHRWFVQYGHQYPLLPAVLLLQGGRSSHHGSFVV